MKHALRPTRHSTLAVLLALACGLSGCIKPPFTMPNDSVIGYDGKHALPPDCDALSRPAVLTDAGVHRPSMQWGCATYTNLAAQVAHPADIVAPQTLGPADGATAASAMRRYETGRVIPLDTSSSRESK
jgi:pilus assembly protein CpaD